MRSENHQLQARLKNVISLEKMKQALETKDQDLVAAQKKARDKTTLADKKLASVSKLEEKNSKLKTAVSEANREVEQLKKDKDSLSDEVGSLKAKKGKLESYLGQLAAKLVLKLEGIFSCSIDLLTSTAIFLLNCRLTVFLTMQNSVKTLKRRPGGSRWVSTQ